MVKSSKCVKCGSLQFVKHGLTQAGVQRFRCIDCSKTWTLGTGETPTVDLANISQQYLDGKTIRELVKYYPTSPVRINHQVRAYLEQCPDWHNFVDTLVPNHNPKQIYLSGKKFNCSWKGGQANKMFVAFAIDAMTSLVIAYKVSFSDSDEIWMDLLTNLKSRNIRTNSFLTNGSENSQEALNRVFPETDKRITFHKNYRDKELGCCLSKLSPSDKLIGDATKIYFLNGNLKLAHFLGYKNEDLLFSFLMKNRVVFMEILKDRLFARTKLYNDNLPYMFQKRFEKFHLLKDDPCPIINGWIANCMLQSDNNGINRLALYTQEPYAISFKKFAVNDIKPLRYNNISSKYIERLLLEVAARGLELPIYVSECSFDINKCLLVG